ncbi:ATP-binding protein, partial [Polaribacter sp.]|nr:ATP-binding protein [Polaribacter sp.]
KFTTKSSGMGLGLPMIKNIVEAYGGSISFTSKEGIGTVFTVIIPKT